MSAFLIKHQQLCTSGWTLSDTYSPFLVYTQRNMSKLYNLLQNSFSLTDSSMIQCCQKQKQMTLPRFCAMCSFRPLLATWGTAGDISLDAQQPHNMLNLKEQKWLTLFIKFSMFIINEMFIEKPHAPSEDQIIKAYTADLRWTDLLSKSGIQHFLCIALIQNKKSWWFM